MRLVLIGFLAGFFSALFGVGGGIVVVPLLVLAAGFPPRAAAGTSLAAIFVIAIAGTIAYGLRGEVEPAPAALVGLPAAIGAMAGARVQQRISTRQLTYAFAALLAGLGVVLLVS